MNFFLRRYEKLGAKFDPSEISVRKSLRVNTLKIDESTLASRLNKRGVRLEKIPFLPGAYWYESDFSLASTNEYLQGYYYLQEAASQTTARVLDPCPGELVLDMSAAPGGKTTQLAALMQNKGLILAVDSNVLRLDSLANNLERLGVKIVVAHKKDARYIDDFNVLFDKLLLDAPCSGNFADDDTWFESRFIQGVEHSAEKQKELLSAAVKVLKKGGVMVYSTCTLEPEENELNIHWLLEKYPDLVLEDTGLEIGSAGLTDIFGEKLNPDIRKCRRFWPHETGTQGFFIARIKRNG